VIGEGWSEGERSGVEENEDEWGGVSKGERTRKKGKGVEWKRLK
jgi:hypothetical protein